jgi:hypothetical protein
MRFRTASDARQDAVGRCGEGIGDRAKEDTMMERLKELSGAGLVVVDAAAETEMANYY